MYSLSTFPTFERTMQLCSGFMLPAVFPDSIAIRFDTFLVYNILPNTGYLVIVKC